MWVGFIVFVHLMLALDRGVFHRKAHVVTVKEALTWSGVGATLGLTFSVCVCCGHENHWLVLGSAIHPVDGVIKVGPRPLAGRGSPRLVSSSGPPEASRRECAMPGPLPIKCRTMKKSGRGARRSG